jgi:hypothetical protein
MSSSSTVARAETPGPVGQVPVSSVFPTQAMMMMMRYIELLDVHPELG